MKGFLAPNTLYLGAWTLTIGLPAAAIRVYSQEIITTQAESAGVSI